MGAKVINISVTACVSAADPLDQGAIGAAVWYAATVKDAVIVAAAGNDSEDGCAQNPMFDPLNPSDPRDWHQVKTVSSPSWFSDYVLSVGAVDNTGAPINKSLAGPWVAAAAPGVGIMGLSPETGGPVERLPADPGRARRTCRSGAPASRRRTSAGWRRWCGPNIPGLSAHQIINRILQTAHNPPRGVDNQVGYGVVDPVAALTFDVPAGDRLATRGAQSRVIRPAAAAAAAGSPGAQRGIWYSPACGGRRCAGGLADRRGRGGSDEASRPSASSSDHRRRGLGAVRARCGWAVGGYIGAAARFGDRHRRWRRPLAGPAGVVMADACGGGAVGRSAGTNRSRWPTTDAGGGVRYQDGVAVAAVQLLGKAHTPTLFTGSTRDVHR